MFWQAIFIDKKLGKNEISGTLSQIFHVNCCNILVVKSLVEAEVGSDIQILCQTFLSQEATFSLRIDIYLREENIIPVNDIVLLGEFCIILQCCILMSDTSVNPFSWWLISDKTTVKEVFVDIDSYDFEEYEPA